MISVTEKTSYEVDGSMYLYGEIKEYHRDDKQKVFYADLKTIQARLGSGVLTSRNLENLINELQDTKGYLDALNTADALKCDEAGEEF